MELLGEAIGGPLPSLPQTTAAGDEANGKLLKVQYHQAWADVALWDTEEEQAFYEQLPNLLEMFPALAKVGSCR